MNIPELNDIKSSVDRIQKQVERLGGASVGRGVIVSSGCRFEIDRSISVSELMKKIGASNQIVTWSTITGKPTTYPPGEHTHPEYDYGRSARFERTISETTDQVVEIGQISLLTASSFCQEITLVCDESGCKYSAVFLVTGIQNCTSGAWMLVASEKALDENGALTFGIEINVDMTTAKFRARINRPID